MKMSFVAVRNLSFALIGTLALAGGCEQKGPAEKAGEAVDQGVQNVKDTVNPPGPGEKAGRAVDDVVKP